MAAEGADVSEGLRVFEPVGDQGAFSAGADVRGVNSAGRFHGSDVMRLLGDQHPRGHGPVRRIDRAASASASGWRNRSTATV